jgi:translation initiation factor IF-3
MKFGDAQLKARELKKDIVLRNVKADPPIFKIMNYRMELLKRLFKKLGKQMEEVDEKKSKALRFTTNISAHDLENKTIRA